MSSRSRGIIQLMTEVAAEMWRVAADAFGDQTLLGDRLEEADEEMNMLHASLTSEVAAEGMPDGRGGPGHPAGPVLRTTGRPCGQPRPTNRALAPRRSW